MPELNDKIEQVFSFAGAKWSGMNTAVMMQSYIVIAKAVSAVSVAAYGAGRPHVALAGQEKWYDRQILKNSLTLAPFAVHLLLATWRKI